MESLPFFGRTMEYSENEMSTFRQIVLISFRSYIGILNCSALGDSSFPPQYLAVLLYRFNWYHSAPIPFVREAFSSYPIFTFEHFKRMISITEPEQEVLRIGEEHDRDPHIR